MSTRVQVLALCSVVALFAVAPQGKAGTFLHAKKPLSQRYIVTLKDTRPDQVATVVPALLRQFDGQLIATMTHAMIGFGAVMTDERAHALSHHPLVDMVEEDEEVILANAAHGSPFTARPFDSANAAQLNHFLARPEANTCPWYGSYWACYYSDDTYWNLDRLDNTGPIYATKAYAYHTTGPGVRVYIVGNGIYGAHQEFDNRVEVGGNMTVDPALLDHSVIEICIKNATL